MAQERCPRCNGLYALIGLRHRCIDDDSPPVKTGGVRDRATQTITSSRGVVEGHDRTKPGGTQAAGRAIGVRAATPVQPEARVRAVHGIAGIKPSPREAKSEGHSSAARAPVSKTGNSGSSPDVPAKRGRPRLEDRDATIEARKPWVEAGMSRRSWYRRQRQEKPKGDFE